MLQWTEISQNGCLLEINPNERGQFYKLGWNKCIIKPSEEFLRIFKNLMTVNQFLCNDEMEYFFQKKCPGIDYDDLSFSTIYIVESLDNTQNDLYKHSLESKLRMFDQNKKEYDNVSWYMNIPIVKYWYSKRFLQLQALHNQIQIDAIQYAHDMVAQYKNLTCEIEYNRHSIILFKL